MYFYIILGISNIGQGLPKEFAIMLLIVGLAAYVSLLIYSTSNEGKKHLSFNGIVENSLFLLSYVSLGFPYIIINELDLESPSFGVVLALLILGVLFMVLIDNKTSKTRHSIASGFVYSLLISIILVSVLPKKTISFEEYDSHEILDLILERNSLDSATQSNLLRYIFKKEKDLVQLLWEGIVNKSTKDLGDSVKSLTFEDRERIFIKFLQNTEGNTISFNWNNLNLIANKDDYFLRDFIFRKYLLYKRHDQQINQ